MDSRYSDEEFKDVFGYPRSLFYAMGAGFALLTLAHLWRLSTSKGWPHAAYALAFLLDSIGAFLIAANDISIAYLGICAYLGYMGTPMFLVALWTNSMRRTIHTGIEVANALAYICLVLVVIRVFGLMIVLANLNLGGNLVFYIDAEVFAGIIWATTGLIFLVSMWMLAVCPKEADISGCKTKRWQIGTLGLTFFLLCGIQTFDYFDILVASFVFLCLLGIVTLYWPQVGYSESPTRPVELPAANPYGTTVTPIAQIQPTYVMVPQGEFVQAIPISQLQPPTQSQSYVQYPVISTPVGAQAPSNGPILMQGAPVYVHVSAPAGQPLGNP
ncbi:hypothetical protein THASP1DRAFT_33734 [Thamnocephalis sphaerospora]|uniref:Uncharacterized protein n=1 Tax=Thamnocephalis sphaerospora TaxID=78915 RepID=A0A4P9XFX4_9FUNG|nr:hypothetical protein THASP1DRAFT_33734 [Thamnocephalis sphaerospora]|eukprot:RKP04494.1 hypothetical protein THASP1DRAFT_33734 [Thamnocephalis sphaerospora]